MIMYLGKIIKTDGVPVAVQEEITEQNLNIYKKNPLDLIHRFEIKNVVFQNVRPEELEDDELVWFAPTIPSGTRGGRPMVNIIRKPKFPLD